MKIAMTMLLAVSSMAFAPPIQAQELAFKCVATNTQCRNCLNNDTYNKGKGQVIEKHFFVDMDRGTFQQNRQGRFWTRTRSLEHLSDEKMYFDRGGGVGESWHEYIDRYTLKYRSHGQWEMVSYVIVETWEGDCEMTSRGALFDGGPPKLGNRAF